MDLEIAYLRFNSLNDHSDEIEIFLKNLSKEKELCIVWEGWDQSIEFWITCQRSWLKKNYPGILRYEVEKEKDHLEWKPENYGIHYHTS